MFGLTTMKRVLECETEIDRLGTLNDDLNAHMDEMQHDYSSPSGVIEAIMKRGIEWYDPASLGDVERQEYSANARNALHNQVLNNEIKHLIADTIKEMPKRSADKDEVRALGMFICGIDALRERLEKVVNPEKREPTKDETYKAV